MSEGMNGNFSNSSLVNLTSVVFYDFDGNVFFVREISWFALLI